MNADFVREILLQVWGEQACRRAEDWPEVLARLMKSSPASPGGFPRASLAPLVDSAVAQLVHLFGKDVPVDPARAVWRAFPRLDSLHCAKLADLLLEARTAQPLLEPAEALP
jgi:hypothetical protein